MEASISSTALRPSQNFSAGGGNLGCLFGTFPIRPRNHNVGFFDNTHLQYYNKIATGRKKEKVKGITTMEKKLNLFTNLSMFSDMGGSVLMQELGDILMTQKQQIKAEKKEMKKKRKEAKIRLKVLKKKSMKKDSESSSSSSDSSDTESELLLGMDRLRNSALAENTPSADSSRLGNTREKLCEVREEDTMQLQLGPAASFCSPTYNMAANKHKVEAITRRIDVCMGSKCKKLGAEALLKELESKIGVEGAVVGCKCMGKCRSAPNVRVSNSSKEDLVQGMDTSARAATNPLYIGVGLQDVDMIVSDILGEDMGSACRTAAA